MIRTDRAAAEPGAPALHPDEVLRVAARVFRERGLAEATLAQVAEAIGASCAAVSACFATKDLLAQAIFAETLRLLNAADTQVWTGYGAGMRKSLAAARSFPDGYVVLVRDAASLAPHRPSWLALRKRSARRLQRLVWSPDSPLPEPARSPLADVAIEPMVSFTITAICQWIETGDPAQDGLFLRWCGQMMRDWRHNTCELLNLDTPDQDWPFDTEGPSLPRRSRPSEP